ncbi:hypothetical protein STEG23_011805, partial [Scotinomys teguina]
MLEPSGYRQCTVITSQRLEQKSHVTCPFRVKGEINYPPEEDENENSAEKTQIPQAQQYTRTQVSISSEHIPAISSRAEHHTDWLKAAKKFHINCYLIDLHFQFTLTLIQYDLVLHTIVG